MSKTIVFMFLSLFAFAQAQDAASRIREASELNQTLKTGVATTSGANNEVLVISGIDFDEETASHFLASCDSGTLFRLGFVTVQITNGNQTWETTLTKTGFSALKNHPAHPAADPLGQGAEITVDEQKRGPRNSWIVQAHNISDPNIVVTLVCSNDDSPSGVHDCEPLQSEKGDYRGGGFRATVLPSDDPQVYKHYLTWKVQISSEQTNSAAGDSPTWFYAVYKFRDGWGATHQGRYPDQPGVRSQFAESGRAINIDLVVGQTQENTDEQAVCLEFVQHATGLTAYNLANNMSLPKVDCYDHLTYTHVSLTNPAERDTPVRGVIMRDTRPGSCSSGGCAIALFIQGCRDYPGDEGENCKNSWSEGIATLGSDMQVTSVKRAGWYDVVVADKNHAASGSPLHRSTYQYVGHSTYKDVDTLAREEKKGADEAKGRRTVALSLGLHSGQPQAQVKAILTAHGYRSVLKAENSPWNCASDGWTDGRRTASCISQKGEVTIKLLFELGKMYRDADTAAFQQVRTDRLIYAQFQFSVHMSTTTGVESVVDPDKTISLVSPTFKKCDGEDHGNGLCFNF